MKELFEVEIWSTSKKLAIGWGVSLNSFCKVSCTWSEDIHGAVTHSSRRVYSAAANIRDVYNIPPTSIKSVFRLGGRWECSFEEVLSKAVQCDDEGVAKLKYLYLSSKRLSNSDQRFVGYMAIEHEQCRLQDKTLYRARLSKLRGDVVELGLASEWDLAGETWAGCVTKTKLPLTDQEVKEARTLLTLKRGVL